jgi:hypothetical protein
MADPREEVELVIAMRDPQLHDVLGRAADFLYRQGVGEGSASVDAARRLLRQAADRLDAARSTQPEGPGESEQGERWTLIRDRDRLGSRAGSWRLPPTHQHANEIAALLKAYRDDDYHDVVEVMPVSEHEAALGQEREKNARLREALEKIADNDPFAGGGGAWCVERARAALAPSGDQQ